MHMDVDLQPRQLFFGEADACFAGVRKAKHEQEHRLRRAPASKTLQPGRRKERKTNHNAHLEAERLVNPPSQHSSLMKGTNSEPFQTLIRTFLLAHIKFTEGASQLPSVCVEQ